MSLRESVLVLAGWGPMAGDSHLLEHWYDWSIDMRCKGCRLLRAR